MRGDRESRDLIPPRKHSRPPASTDASQQHGDRGQRVHRNVLHFTAGGNSARSEKEKQRLSLTHSLTHSISLSLTHTARIVNIVQLLITCA